MTGGDPDVIGSCCSMYMLKRVNKEEWFYKAALIKLCSNSHHLLLTKAWAKARLDKQTSAEINAVQWFRADEYLLDFFN